MNIFATHACPVKSAEYLWSDNPKRAIKMILESVQLLCNAVDHWGGLPVYKVTHKNHPCSKWVSKNPKNAAWLIEHCKHLFELYTRHYNRVHKSYSAFTHCKYAMYSLLYCGGKWSRRDPFVNCAGNKSLGLDFTNIQNVHTAYKKYLKARKIL